VRALLASSSIGVATPAASAAEPRVRGPASVTPGRIIAFHADGFRPGSLLNVVLSPAARPSCCAIRIRSTFLVSPRGGAAVRFRMPLFYLRCLEGGHCRKIRWNLHERVVVNVFGYLQQAATTTAVER
jgi:hypothetical protein